MSPLGSWIRFPLAKWAASEIEIRAEQAMLGDHDYTLLSAYSDQALIVFTPADPEVLETLATGAVNLANGLDQDLSQGSIQDPDERRVLRYACQGLWGVACRIRKHAWSVG